MKNSETDYEVTSVATFGRVSDAAQFAIHATDLIMGLLGLSDELFIVSASLLGVVRATAHTFGTAAHAAAIAYAAGAAAAYHAVRHPRGRVAAAAHAAEAAAVHHLFGVGALAFLALFLTALLDLFDSFAGRLLFFAIVILAGRLCLVCGFVVNHESELAVLPESAGDF